MGESYPGLVDDGAVDHGDKLDECLVELESDVPNHRLSEAFPGAAQYVSLPRVEWRMQGPGQPVHSVEMSEKLFVGHDIKGDCSRCRMTTPIKFNPALATAVPLVLPEAVLLQSVAFHPFIEGASGDPQDLPGGVDLALAFPEGRLDDRLLDPFHLIAETPGTRRE